MAESANDRRADSPVIDPALPDQATYPSPYPQAGDRQTELEVTAQAPSSPADEPGHDELPSRDRLIVTALASGRTHAEAAELASVSTKTVQRRLGDPDVQAAIEEERRQHFERIAASLTQASSLAIETLKSILNAEKPADQLRAAEALLGHSRRYHHQILDHEFARRLDRLESGSDPTNDNQADRQAPR